MTQAHQPHVDRLLNLATLANEAGNTTAIVPEVVDLTEEEAKLTLLIAVGIISNSLGKRG